MDFSKRKNKNVFIRRDGHGIVRYSAQQAIVPCRADFVARDSYWVTDPTRNGALIFLPSPEGHMPQHSIDDMVIQFMKQILFPWCEIKKLPAVYLVRHGRQGWCVPYGELNNY